MSTKTKSRSKPIKKVTASKVESLKAYFDSIDFEEWWEEFATSFNKNGTFKYQTIYSFIKVKAKSDKQKKFLWWILGPTVELGENETIGNVEYADFKQIDFAKCRDNGFWYSNKNVEKIKQEALRMHNAMDEVRAIGKVNLDDVVRIKAILDQLDREYGGLLNLPEYSAKENALRIGTYTKLRQDLQNQLHGAQMMYAKTRGVDMSQLEGLLQIAGASILGTITGASQGKEDPALAAKVHAFDSLRDMMIAKSQVYDMPLPDKDMEKIITERVVTIDKKKVH